MADHFSRKPLKSYRMFLACVAFLLMSACAYPVSNALREQVDPRLSLDLVFQGPENYTGQKIILGGVIVAIRNLEGVTEIEVVEKRLDASGYPMSEDMTRGRFIFKKAGFLEPEIFEKGREITGGGLLTGTQAGKVGEVDYRFPVVEAEELKLWPLRPQYYYAYPPGYYGPWGSPYWRSFGFNRWGYPYYW